LGLRGIIIAEKGKSTGSQKKLPEEDYYSR